MEANTAQNTLQKEITTLRESNRNMQMKLRDIEVANDDYERQARNTTSSLEDMESKFNVAIERNVMSEEEIKITEKEREELRIENQRLRDELSDLRVEAEVRQEKLKHAEEALGRLRKRQTTPFIAISNRPESVASERSPIDTASTSPTVATPPTKSVSSIASDIQTPPSPPTSDKSNSARLQTPAPRKPRMSITNSSTPKPLQYSSQVARQSRLPSSTRRSSLMTPAGRRTTLGNELTTLPSSTSLHQIRGLIGKMQKLEQRVQYARSKLPAPTSTPPRGSPRPGSALSQSAIPASVTVRSSRKRGSTAAANAGQTLSETVPDKISRPSSRLSYGNMMSPPQTREVASKTISRPSSRASLSSRQSISNLPNITASVGRPSSRQSTRTPMGHYPTQAERIQRPRSSIGGSYSSTQGHSSSVSRLSNYGMEESPDGDDASTPTPSFRASSSAGMHGSSGIPLPSKRLSGAGLSFSRRISVGPERGDMAPPEKRQPLNDIGETF